MSIDNNILKSLKVLYVEDEEEVLDQMVFFLKKRVGKLIVAHNGREGIDAFKQNIPDIVISDLKMPHTDGIAMSREIRRISDVPIIITTAFSDKDIILRAVDVGIEKYVIKPIDVRELIKVMEKSAVKILRNRGELISVRNMIFSKEEKLVIEENIKNSIAKYIKEKTGKGPKNVKAFIHSNTLEIEIFEVLTKMEKALLENKQNISIVEYNRNAFYKDSEEHMKTTINKFLPGDLKLEYIEIDTVNDKNKLKFTII